MDTRLEAHLIRYPVPDARNHPVLRHSRGELSSNRMPHARTTAKNCSGDVGILQPYRVPYDVTYIQNVADFQRRETRDSLKDSGTPARDYYCIIAVP